MKIQHSCRPCSSNHEGFSCVIANTGKQTSFPLHCGENCWPDIFTQFKRKWMLCPDQRMQSYFCLLCTWPGHPPTWGQPHSWHAGPLGKEAHGGCGLPQKKKEADHGQQELTVCVASEQKQQRSGELDGKPWGTGVSPQHWLMGLGWGFGHQEKLAVTWSSLNLPKGHLL